MIHIKHINFIGSTTILGYSVHSLSADHTWDITMSDTGLVRIARGHEICYVGPSMWKSVEVLVTDKVTQGSAMFDSALGSSNVAAASNIPEGMYRNTDGELEAPVVAKNIHRQRKTPKAQ